MVIRSGCSLRLSLESGSCVGTLVQRLSLFFSSGFPTKTEISQNASNMFHFLLYQCLWSQPSASAWSDIGEEGGLRVASAGSSERKPRLRLAFAERNMWIWVKIKPPGASRF